MRKLTDHIVNPANDLIEIAVLDEPGQGGACHDYRVRFMNANGVGINHMIQFQNGPIADVGVNGLTHEVLLAIIADRLRAFQAGPYACRDNELALEAVTEARFFLQRRTKERMDRGVEGTHQK